MARRVAVVGIDGFSPDRMDRYLEAGALPAIGRVRREGVSAPLVSTLPATTPVAWATIATGALPSATGIEGFLVHQPGDRLDHRVSGCYSYRCRAETLWEVMASSGRRAHVVKFPVSYPSETAALRVDGAAGWGGLKCLHEAASRAVVSTCDGPPSTRVNPHRWIGESESQQVIGRWSWSIPSLWARADTTVNLRLMAGPRGPLVEVASQPDTSTVLASLAVGEWSDPLTVDADCRTGRAAVSFRVKVMHCSSRPPSVRLLHTALHERTGHSSPEEPWKRHLATVGPIEEQTEPSLLFDGQIDLASQLELFGLNVEWLQRISTNILENDEWELFMVHTHVVDWAHHLLHGALDERHPDYDADTAPRYARALRATYALADALVASVADAAGPDADVVVVGDHGQDLRHTTFRTNEWLAQEGLLKWSGEDVDWDSTRAFATGNYIHFNVLGREPTGILTPIEAERLADIVIDRLMALRDPTRMGSPILCAARKRDLSALGADGAGVGDVVFCLRSGYEATNGAGPVFSGTRILREYTSGHEHFWPLDPRIQTRLFAAGPSFRSGHVRVAPGHISDIAPTLSSVLGARAPRQATGAVLTDLLVNGDSRAGCTKEDLDLQDRLAVSGQGRPA